MMGALPEGGESRQERRAEKLRKQRQRMRKHSRNLARIYRDAILKRLRGRRPGAE